jgi:hypothetical protein
MTARHCPCGAELVTAADLAHSVCDECRVTAHKRVTRRPKANVEDVPLFDVEPAQRHLVRVDHWPDYRAEGLI